MAISSYPSSGLSKNVAIIYSTQPFKTQPIGLTEGIYSGKKDAGENLEFVDSQGNIRTVGTASELVNFPNTVVSVRPVPKQPVATDVTSPALAIPYREDLKFFDYSTANNKAYYLSFTTANQFTSSRGFYNESTDLITWTSQRLQLLGFATNRSPSISVLRTVRGSSFFLALETSYDPDSLYKSTDGITWSSIAHTGLDLATTITPTFIYGEGASHIISLNRENHKQSTDGVTWTSLLGASGFALSSGSFAGGAYLNNTYMAYASETIAPRVIFSTNRTTWQQFTGGGAGYLTGPVVNISFANDYYILHISDGTPRIYLYPKTSLTTASRIDCITPFVFRGQIAYKNNFYFTKYQSSIYFSTNASTWTAVAGGDADTANRYAISLLDNEGAYYLPPYKVEPVYYGEYVFLSEGRTKEIEV